MKIIFLCGSLEPGRDGVGDFTRRLSGELIRQGHNVAAMALNDSYVVRIDSTAQDVDGVVLPILRFPSIQSIKVRLEQAKEWINNFNPDWLGLQYVPFSFHVKGLPFGLSKLLIALGQNRPWYIMFHELWIGMNKEAPVKYVCWGWLQKQLIKSLVSNLKPKVIQTQTLIYQVQLNNLGYVAGYLPLFSNIPAINVENPSSVKANDSLNSEPEISLVIFGAIQPGAPIEDFAKEVADYAKKEDSKVSLLIIGRGNDEQKHWSEIFKSVGITVSLLGEQSPVRISELLRSSSVGISTTPIALAEKSGSVMAMREHGLPVICVSKPWQPRGFFKLSPPAGILEYRRGNLDLGLSVKLSLPIINTVSETSKIFTNSILAAG